MPAQAIDMRPLAIALSSRHRRPLIVYPRYRADCQQPTSRRRHDCHVIAQTGWGTYKNQHVRVTHTDSQRRPIIIQAVVLGALSRYARTPIFHGPSDDSSNNPVLIRALAFTGYQALAAATDGFSHTIHQGDTTCGVSRNSRCMRDPLFWRCLNRLPSNGIFDRPGTAFRSVSSAS